MKLLRKVFFQLINKKLRRMKQMHDDDSVVLRRKNKKIPADSSGLGDRRRLSWSISDLSRLPAVRTSSTLVKTRCSRVRNTRAALLKLPPKAVAEGESVYYGKLNDVVGFCVQGHILVGFQG